MKLSMQISYDVNDADEDVVEVVNEIVDDEARTFASSVRRRLAAAGVTNIQMTVSS